MTDFSATSERPGKIDVIAYMNVEPFFARYSARRLGAISPESTQLRTSPYCASLAAIAQIRSFSSSLIQSHCRPF